jgi:hypothetical protein
MIKIQNEEDTFLANFRTNTAQVFRLDVFITNLHTGGIGSSMN